ncbi:hypothetical protein GCM10023115_05320 [Pontixanthobacter gangjinensis]|uniref:Sulfotransferase domain-containing protein n=1 Tax=Pontixanthobacter gangjinensis TaxID=1028742 RepID=A0A6I4SLW9_9SPHN|nr:hypothetical protein [Pontixanthobacter gangjinensis]MXO55782.1 hypothetical protein [Pontixanthobacter gangjinensis]
MAADILQSDLLRSSVIVTGSHYSMTTLIGRLLASAPQFHLLHEPTNAQPTLSYDSLAPTHWYEFYDEARSPALGEFLLLSMQSKGISREVLRRAGRVRSAEHALQVARYVQRKLPMILAPKPAIIKDPFLLFSARDLQRLAKIRVVLTVRHPCAFAESFIRAGNGFDFANLLQPQVLEAMPDEAEAIGMMAKSSGDLIDQAALLWRVLYGFADRYLSGNDLTCIVRQDEIVQTTDVAVNRLLAFSGATRSDDIDQFITENFTSGPADFDKGGSYIRRDGLLALNKWRGRLHPGEVSRIRRVTEGVAAAFDYGPETWLQT